MKKIYEFNLGRGNPKNQRNFIPVLIGLLLGKKNMFFNKQLEQFP